MPFQAGAKITTGTLNRYMGSAGVVANDSFTTTNKVMTDDAVTFTAIAGHVYQVSWDTQLSGSTTLLATIKARWIAGSGPVTTSSTEVWSRVANVTAANDGWHFSRTITGLSGLVTVGITALTNTGTATVYGGANGRELLVKDLGL